MRRSSGAVRALRPPLSSDSWLICRSVSATSTLPPAGSPAAPRTIEAIKAAAAARREAHPLPLDRRVDVDPVRRLPAGPRLREPHLPSRAGSARDLPGRHQRVRDLLPVRRLHDGVQGRPARGEPLRDGRARRGLGGPAARDRPALPLGRGPGHLDPRGDEWLRDRGPRRDHRGRADRRRRPAKRTLTRTGAATAARRAVRRASAGVTAAGRAVAAVTAVAAMAAAAAETRPA